MALLMLAVLPVFVIGMVKLFVAKRRNGLGLALIFFALTVATGFWAISKSRSSTAAIGIIFLPFYGSIAGVLGWAFGNLKDSAKWLMRLLGWVCLLGAAGIVVLLLVDGNKTVQRNAQRDAALRVMAKEYAEDCAAIQAMLQTNRGHEAEVLNPLIASRINDRSFVIAALQQPYVSADLLDRLADSKDLGTEAAVAKNPNCRGATLARLYRTSSYPPYHYQALAANPHTPPDIMREIYFHEPQLITGLAHWFAQNPATPKDILDDIAKHPK